MDSIRGQEGWAAGEASCVAQKGKLHVTEATLQLACTTQAPLCYASRLTPQGKERSCARHHRLGKEEAQTNVRGIVLLNAALSARLAVLGVAECRNPNPAGVARKMRRGLRSGRETLRLSPPTFTQAATPNHAAPRSLDEQPHNLDYRRQQIEGREICGKLPQAAAKQGRGRHGGSGRGGLPERWLWLSSAWLPDACKWCEKAGTLQGAGSYILGFEPAREHTRCHCCSMYCVTHLHHML